MNKDHFFYGRAMTSPRNESYCVDSLAPYYQDLNVFNDLIMFISGNIRELKKKMCFWNSHDVICCYNEIMILI